MTSNYNASTVGVPYVRVSTLIVNWPDALGGAPSANIQQNMAVVLADGTVRNLESIPPIVTELDFSNNGNTPIQVVDPVTGDAIAGTFTTLNETFAQVVAVIRQYQIASGQ